MADINVIALPSMVIEGMKLHVVRYDLDEAMDRVSQLVCVLSSGDEMLPTPESVIDKPASFSLDRSDGSQSRAYVGTIVEAEVAPRAQGEALGHTLEVLGHQIHVEHGVPRGSQGRDSILVRPERDAVPMRRPLTEHASRTVSRLWSNTV